MSNVTMYSTGSCPFCVRADQYLQRKGVSGIRKIMVDQDRSALAEMHAITARRSVPQIFIGDRHVGGYDDLVRLDREGQLDALLAAQTCGGA
ncbi:MAG: glutaredoxin 3 [Gammaproteobacteria bacterium RIFCSPHIGHO2_12_FULL_63_22]|nr:MAG: glutaredoxin 3 [Gammaproteobacteria bacterium RIFCSPHIGHO2_12_FULL_63_22]